MKEPKYILPHGTRIITHETLGSTAGMLIAKRYLDARRESTPGIICGIVGGHGGDVYWARHEFGVLDAAYCFDEFEYDPAFKQQQAQDQE